MDSQGSSSLVTCKRDTHTRLTRRFQLLPDPPSIMIVVNYRRRVQLFLLFLTICFMSAATHWTPYAGIFALLFFLLIVDYLFLNEGDFVFDPNYRNWARKMEPKY